MIRYGKHGWFSGDLGPFETLEECEKAVRDRNAARRALEASQMLDKRGRDAAMDAQILEEMDESESFWTQQGRRMLGDG